VKGSVCLLCALVVVGCQSMAWVQYHVPTGKEAAMKGRLSEIAQTHGLSDRTETSLVPDIILYFVVGDRSFTDLGARRWNDKVIVDLQFRCAGLGGKTFDAMKPKVLGALRELYGGEVTEITERSELIPLHWEEPVQPGATEQ